MYFNVNSIIKKKIIISSNNTNSKNQLNIAYGIDKNFSLGCCISITSILLSNQNCNFAFHIFTNFLDDDFQNKLNQLVDQNNICITIYLIDDNPLINLPTTKNWTIATYFRFLVADYFYNKIDKILYLDADVVCNGSLQDLFTLNFEDNIAFVVSEKDSYWWTKCANRLNENRLIYGYFNAGFLLINLNKWQQYKINDKALEFLTDTKISKKLTHLDQDVLNLLLIEKIKFLDRKYNQQVNINYELKYKLNSPHKLLISDETIMIHYIGPTKPWHNWAKDYTCSKYFLNTKALSPWKSTPLLSATTTTQMRYCAKHNLHQKKFFTSFFYFIKYSIYRINYLKILTFNLKKR